MALTGQRKFTGREKYKKIFLDKLIAPQAKDEYRLLTFYGVGGQGKSTLVSYFLDQKIDQEDKTFSEWAKSIRALPNYKIASVDFKQIRYQQPHEALMKIRQDFLGTGIKFYNFELAFSYYLKKVNKYRNIKTVYPELFRQESSLFNDIADVISDFVPGASLARLVINQAIKLRPEYQDWLQNEGSLLEIELHRLNQQELLDKLPKYFGKDIKEAYNKATTPRLVIMMDTYEALWGRLDAVEVGNSRTDKWVRELVTACPGILFVFLGRDYLKWDALSKSRPNRNYTAMLADKQHLIERLSKQDANLFLQTGGIAEAKIRKKIIASSAGLPFYLDIQLDTYFEIKDDGDEPQVTDFGDTELEILDRFLDHLNESQRHALLVLGQAQILDQNIFNLLKDRFFNGLAVDFSTFIRHSFISKVENAEQYQMHQLMRDYLQENVKQNDPKRYQKIQTHLFEHYDQIAIVTDIKEISLEQEEAFIEANYHKQKLGFDEYTNWFYEREKPFREAGRYNLLIPLHKNLLELSKASIGETHPDYASRLNNLALLLRSMGRYDEAEPLFRQAIEIGKLTIGETHPDYAGRLNNLALLLRSMGRYDEAEPLFRQAIEIGKLTIGETHPDYASRLNNLALLLRSMGRYDEAEPLFRQAIKIFESVLGKKHPNTVTVKENYQQLLDIMSNKE